MHICWWAKFYVHSFHFTIKICRNKNKFPHKRLQLPRHQLRKR